ncbi:MAG TPA: hypothetical protein VFZ37_02350 [Jiangellaceae bacterium]
MQLRKLVVPVVAVALGATACGGDESPSADETPAGSEAEAEASADDAEDADESDDESTETVSGGDEVDAEALFAAIADAVVEAGSYEFETTSNAGGQELTVTGAIEVSTDISEANMRLTTDVMGSQSTVLFVDGQFYMELSEEMGFPTEMGSWMTVDPEGDDPFAQQMNQAFEDIGSATDLVAQLAENPDLLTVTEVGSADVDGTDTTEYLVVVNDVAAFQGLSGAENQIGELVFSMWIDGDNLPRRHTADVDGSASVDTTYTNYGVDVDVEAPPADEVLDMSELMNQ